MPKPLVPRGDFFSVYLDFSELTLVRMPAIME
jgi:hypothetical protein